MALLAIANSININEKANRIWHKKKKISFTKVPKATVVSWNRHGKCIFCIDNFMFKIEFTKKCHSVN